MQEIDVGDWSAMTEFPLTVTLKILFIGESVSISLNCHLEIFVIEQS